MAEALTATRRRWGTVRASITKLETQIKRWEDKEELSATDQLSVQRHMEDLKEYGADVRKHHFDVVELMNEDDLTAEQDVLDEHADKVTDYTDRLQQLLLVPEKVSKKASDTTLVESLLKRLRYVVMKLTSLNDTADSITRGPSMDTCILQQLRRQVNNMDSELADIIHKIPSLDSGEKDLMEERLKG